MAAVVVTVTVATALCLPLSVTVLDGGLLRYAWAVSLTREEVLLELIDEHDVAVLRSTWE